MSDVLAHLDEALERVIRLREQLLGDSSAENRAERLAWLFTCEARAWSQLFEASEHRMVWRAALVAEQVARRNAAAWARRSLVERAHPTLTALSTDQTSRHLVAVGAV